MNRNLFFLSLSFVIHLILFAFLQISYTFFSKPFVSTPISIQVEEKQPRPEAKQIVEQNTFNHKAPEETRYLSQYNNTTTREEKGKLTDSRSLVQSFFHDGSLNGLEGELEFSHPYFRTGRIDLLPYTEKEGSHNFLNTKEVWFFTFFSRVKHQIYWHWVKELESELGDSGNMFPEFSEKKLLTTRIEAYLDSEGYLRSLVIRKKSGLEELDLASAQALKNAHPFPNPPKPLISEDGSLRLEYTFALSYRPSHSFQNF